MDRADHVEEVHLASGASLEPIAGDDTGGTYFLCAGSAVLYASSEGDAVLIADSVSEAVEMLVRVPRYCEDISGDLDEDQLRAAVDAADAQAREDFAPELDAHRAALLAGLGLPDRPLTELVALMEAAVERTDPDYLLLNSHELRAYRLMDESSRRPLRDIVLDPGRAMLARVRAGDPGARDEAVADAVLRAGVVRAAQYDRRDGDLPLLRSLLERETAERGTEWYTERQIAAMLVALHGEEEDLPRVRAATDGAAGSRRVCPRLGARHGCRPLRPRPGHGKRVHLDRAGPPAGQDRARQGRAHPHAGRHRPRRRTARRTEPRTRAPW